MCVSESEGQDERKELLLGGTGEEIGDDLMISDECIDYHYTMRINTTTIKFV